MEKKPHMVLYEIYRDKSEVINNYINLMHRSKYEQL
jgi:hypothetical protein